GWIGRRMDRADAALVAFAGLSSGLAPLLAVVALPNVILRRPGARTILLVAVGAALIQGVTAIATPREAPGSTPRGLADVASAVAAGVASRGLATGGEPVRSRRIAAAALVPALAVFLAIGFARSFRLEARASSGPDVSQELATAEAACTPASRSVTITISPHPATNLWEVRVPCERLAR